MQKALKGYRTRRRLADALKELLHTKPLEKVRIHELTERCDIHRQTFYYHFDDIYDLFFWCVQQDEETLPVRLARSPSWQEALFELLAYIAENRGYFTAVLNHMPPARRQTFWSSLLTAVLEKSPCACPTGQERGADPHWQSLLMMCSTLLEKWVREEPGQSPELIIRFLENFSPSGALA